MRLWLIGCGNMAGAMLRRWIESGTIDPADVDVVNRHDRDLPAGVRQARALPAGPVPDAVILGVKPQQLADAAADYAEQIAGAPLLVSMLAGVDPSTLAAAFPGPEPIQTMPNLPVEIGRGVVAVHAPDASAAARDAVNRLMAPLGLVEWFAEASAFAAAGALSGTGPAFLFRFIDALSVAGQAQGLSPSVSAAIALATVEGAGTMAAHSERSPAALADAVASPGGMTREALNILDQDRALAGLLERTLAAAIRRGEEMAAASRG